LTYLGMPNPQPTHYDVIYMYKGKERELSIPNDPTGWEKATEQARQQMGNA